MSDPFENKDALLAAIASAGSQGRAAYEQAIAVSRAQQAAASQAALHTSIPLNAEQSAAVTSNLADPYNQRVATLAGNEALSGDYFNKLGANTGAYIDKTKGVLELTLAQQAAAQAASGGSGGGRGGGGSGSSDATDWQTALKQFGSTQAYQSAGLLDAAKNYGDVAGKPLTERARDYAVEQLGVPGYVAEKLVPNSKYLTDQLTLLQQTNPPSIRKVKKAAQSELDKTTKSGQRVYPWTPQSPVERRYVVQQARNAGIPTYRQAQKIAAQTKKKK